MNDKVVIAGTVKLRNTIKAKTNLHNTINGTPSWVVNTGGGGIVYPHYTGSYTVTPSGSVQTLDTSDKVLDNDVTVQAVAQGSATTPATIITADPTISVSSGGLITATVSKTQQITPTVQEGYVEAGTPGNVGVSGSNTQQLTVQSAQTIHPASTDQTIASGKYLTGAQTFKAVTVSGLTADKILQGNVVKIGDADDDDRIMSVTGTAQGGITPTGTKSITANGTGIDVYNYQYADVAVPNSYSAGDEGKVVSNGTLVAQTSQTVTENGTYNTTTKNEVVVNVSGGSDEDEPLKDVVFIDYDGSIVQQYTKSEFLALTAMPANPSHTGLTAQGWNWTLTDAKTYVTNYGCLVIGQSYTTSDGKTKIYITVDDSDMLDVNLFFKATNYNAVTVNWGDGQSSSIPSANANNITHTYSSTGDYVITIEVSTGTYYLGYNGSSNALFGTSVPPQSRYVKKVEIGNNVTKICRQCFQGLYNMETITIPSGVEIAKSDANIFVDCSSLKGLVLPSGSNMMGQNVLTENHSIRLVSFPKWSGGNITANLSIAIRNCYKMRMLTLPEITFDSGKTVQCINGLRAMKRCIVPFSCTNLASDYVRYCYSLKKFTILSTVTNIADYAMQDDKSLVELHLLPTSPPVLANARAFAGGASGRIIYVPYSEDHSILNAYKTASNWSTYASEMQEEPQ